MQALYLQVDFSLREHIGDLGNGDLAPSKVEVSKFTDKSVVTTVTPRSCMGIALVLKGQIISNHYKENCVITLTMVSGTRVLEIN